MIPELTKVVSHENEVRWVVWYAGGAQWTQYEWSRQNDISYSLVAAMSHKYQIMWCENHPTTIWRDLVEKSVSLGEFWSKWGHWGSIWVISSHSNEPQSGHSTCYKCISTILMPLARQSYWFWIDLATQFCHFNPKSIGLGAKSLEKLTPKCPICILRSMIALYAH